MPHLFVKPTRKLFLSICGCSLILFLLFYLHATRVLEKSEYNKSARVVLRHELFKNVTRTQVPNVCHKRHEPSKTTTSLVFVLSAPHNIKRRQMIRSGWGQKRISLFLGSGVLFVVGESRDLGTQLRMESEIFGDVIHTSFGSSRAEKALNIMTAMRWASENCKKVDFIVKVTDDVFVNPFALERFLVHVHNQRLSTGQQKNKTNRVNSEKLQGALPPTVVTLTGQANLPSSNLRRDENHDTDSDQKSESSRELKQHDGNTVAVPGTESGTTTPDQGYAGTHNSNQKQPQLSTRNTNSIPDGKHCIYCLVWRNITMVKSSKSRWSREEDDHQDFTENPPHCSPHGYVIPSETSRKLIDAYEMDYSDDIAHWAADFYVTGLLSNYAGVQHQNIQDRYAFDMSDVDENSVFIPLGSDVDVISGSVWKMLIEGEEDMGNVNRMD